MDIQVEINEGEMLKNFIEEVHQRKNSIFGQENMSTILKNISILSEGWITKYNSLLFNFNQIRRQNYTQGLRTNDYQVKKDLLLKHLQDGYRLIHYIREMVTGQEILYNILISSENNTQYYMLEMDMETLLNNASLSVSAGAYAKELFKTSEGQLKSDYETLNLTLNTAYSNLKNAAMSVTKMERDDNNSQQGSYGDTLYNDLYKTYFDTKINFNRGHILEVYSYLTTRANAPYKTNRHYKMNTKLITTVVDYVKNSTPSIAAGDTTKETKDGELVGIQLKNIVESAAQLINSSSIVKWLEKANEAFSKTTKTEMINSLEELFTENVTNIEGMSQALDRAFSAAAKKGIKSFVDSVL